MPLHADDVLLVVNTVTSSAAFREDESWLPLCLPRFNPKGFLYAHVSFVAPEVCLVLLTAQADGFPQLSACRQQIAAKLQQEGELSPLEEEGGTGHPNITCVRRWLFAQVAPPS